MLSRTAVYLRAKPRLAWAGGVILASLAVFAAADASLNFAMHGERTSPLWLPNAIALAICLKTSTRRWPSLLAVCLAAIVSAHLAFGDSPLVSLCLSGCNILEVVICAALVRRFAGAGVDLTRPNHLWVFVSAAAVAPLLPTALAVGSMGLLRGEHPSVALWSMSNGVGLVMLTPPLLAFCDLRTHLKTCPITLRRLAPLGLLAAATVAVFGQTAYPVMFVILPLWALAASELEMVGVATGALIVGPLSIGLTDFGRGPAMLALGSPNDKLLLIEVFMAFSTVAMLLFTALVIQRRRLTRSLQEMAAKAEAAREEAIEFTRRSQMAEEVSGLGYWRYDARTGQMDWSPQVYAMFGLDRSEAPRQGALLEYIHPDDLAHTRDLLQRCLTTGEPQYCESRILRGDGDGRILQSWAKAERDPQGQVRAVLCALTDVTERRRTETELRQARDQAEQAAVVKAEFLANMSHELRTPLTAILGFTSLAEAQPDLPAEARRCVKGIGAGSKALLTLVNDVLDFSKLEAGEIRIVPRPTDMVGLARETVHLLTEQARAGGIDLRLDVADGVPALLLLDGDRLRQVLINLIGNAVKFTRHGAVALEIGYDAGAERLSVAVADTGPGISADQRSQLFQRFSQIDGSATRAYGGAGLGLAICKGLVEAMGGGIGVDSEMGVGSRFWFELPVQASAAERSASAVAGPAQVTPGSRFLVVDDNRSNRDLVKAVLGSMGAEVVEAEDGPAGVTAAEARPFDVILMDLRMPGLSGEDAAAKIRRGHGANLRTPIIAFSASADPHQMDDLRQRGFDGALPKPFTIIDLITAVESVMAPAAADEPQAVAI